MAFLFMVLLVLTALFLIFLILIQRGKGGGLAGAFGGLGGQSAFGTKAGDTFTRITIGAAAFWIALCILSVTTLGTRKERLQLGGPPEPPQQGGEAPAAGMQGPPEPADQSPQVPSSPVDPPPEQSGES